MATGSVHQVIAGIDQVHSMALQVSGLEGQLVRLPTVVAVQKGNPVEPGQGNAQIPERATPVLEGLR